MAAMIRGWNKVIKNILAYGNKTIYFHTVLIYCRFLSEVRVRSMNSSATSLAPSPERKPPELRESFFFLSRAFYAYVVTLEKVLKEQDLQDVVRPGMGNVFYERSWPRHR